MRPIKEILFTKSEHDLILIQPNFLMRILEEEQNEIVRTYGKVKLLKSEVKTVHAIIWHMGLIHF